ncbi:ferrochelatase [Zavarzinia aquatilis]|uniref:Ferrochelatase n=1 Tax=Zavarzinia aquatilis TaxID=2211142 RepID=A0A317E7J9_9PROT|nr:ferrochelatase [Zavarzinia aquatilis]PWR22482.1 ferrochelatase [Zavarzinia aquatilis]
MTKRLAVVLFNLGGPDKPASVRPFLFNLFSDPAIIRLPQPLRWLVARLISGRREKTAQEIYARLGGRSPILPLTEKQAAALTEAIEGLGLGVETRCFIAMRYWHPRAAETAKAVSDFAPDEVVLLPLYPQFSTTTTASSFAEWRKAAAKAGIAAKTASICCYPVEQGWVQAQSLLIGKALDAMGDTPFRLLFSAHGLPKKVVEAGDPYQDQVEMTAKAVVAALGRKDLDWVVSYQSRVGPLEWIAPYTEAEIRRAGEAGLALVVVPIAFVSEHSETLVELDIEYRELAEHAGVSRYIRVPAVGDEPAFIAGLARLVATARGHARCAPDGGARICNASRSGCACISER